MADTLQTVQWSLGADGHRGGGLWLPPGYQPIEDVLWESIRGLGLEQRMRATFEITEPLWYGLWIGSPLTANQCSLLQAVLTETARLEPGYAKHIQDFVRALADSVETGEPLGVELAPPGHIDFGWITTFVHCPRCKAEGPVKRWQETYSQDVLECPVCRYSYSPAATYSTERELFAETVQCPSCQAVHRVRDFSDDEIQILEDRHAFEASRDELSWLRRVEEFYRRHPGLEGEIKPHFLMVLESHEPGVRELMMAGIPFDEIELPSDEAGRLDRSRAWSEDDREIIDYLRHHHWFSLPDRMKYVEQSIEELAWRLFQGSAVRCSRCGGELG